MTQRRQYKITINGQLADIKFAWNTARAAVSGLILNQLTFGQRAEMRVSKYIKDDDGCGFKLGHENWLDDKGNNYSVVIERV